MIILWIKLTHCVKNPPLNFIKIRLSYGISECRYAPGTSKVAMLCPSYSSIISVQNNDSKDTIGDETLSISFRCIFAYCHIHRSFPLFCHVSSRLVTTRDVHYFHTRSHLRAPQNGLANLSAYFSIIFKIK